MDVTLKPLTPLVIPAGGVAAARLLLI